MSDIFLRKHAFLAVYGLFSIQSLNKSFIFHASKRINIATNFQKEKMWTSTSWNRNDIVIVITMDWTKYDM